MSNIVFYCKECEEMAECDKVKNMYVYKCKKCNQKTVAFGTKKSIKNFYHLPDSVLALD